jgi:hypothetical protein
MTTTADYAEAVARLEQERTALDAEIAELETAEQRLAVARVRRAGIDSAINLLKDGTPA